MSPLESSSPTWAGPEYSNMMGAQIKDLKSAFMTRIEAHEEDMFKPYKEIYENTVEGNE